MDRPRSLKSTHAEQPRKRIIAPGSFSSMVHSSYDPEISANNSNLTVFKILNPGANPNTPKVDPRSPQLYRSFKSPRNVDLNNDNKSDETTIGSTSGSDILWNPCNRPPKDFGAPPPLKVLSKRPTSARSSLRDTKSPMSEAEQRTGRKLLIELEEELVAKTLKLEETKKISALVRLKTQLQKDALQKKLEDLDIQKRDLLEAVISTRKSLELIQYALPTGEQSKS